MDDFSTPADPQLTRPLNETSIPRNTTDLDTLSACKVNSSHGDVSNLAVVVYRGIIPTLCLVGILGNILNLAVLTHRSWKELGRLEMFVKTGLVALATADMGVCLSVLPWLFIDFERSNLYTSISFGIVYKTYSPFVINTFMLTSTLFTVTLAVGRYLAIQWPIEMRARINKTFTRVTILAVSITSLLFNLPRLWSYKINRCHMAQHDRIYYYWTYGWLYVSKNHLLYASLYFTVATAIPIVILTLSNILLVRNIRRSQSYCLQYTPSLKGVHRSSRGGQQVSAWVLVSIVLMHISLVTPSEVINFVSQLPQFVRSSNTYLIVVAIVNVLAVCNYAFNFLLYCILNGHFRLVIRKALIHCCNLCKCQTSAERQVPCVPLQEQVCLVTKSTVTHT